MVQYPSEEVLASLDAKYILVLAFDCLLKQKSRVVVVRFPNCHVASGLGNLTRVVGVHMGRICP